jgi:hypothetical protein
MKDCIVLSTIEKMKSRSEIGMAKYGTTLQENNKDNYLTHLQEELMDAILYIEKLMKQQEEINTIVSSTPNDSDLGKKIRQWLHS